MLQAFYTDPLGTALMERLHDNLLNRWFYGRRGDDPVWVPTVFSKNRDRLPKAAVARTFFAEPMTHKEVRALSNKRFSVDGKRVQTWASMKGFVAKDGSDDPPSPDHAAPRAKRRLSGTPKPKKSRLKATSATC